MTKEDFIEKFGLDEDKLSHIPEYAEIMTDDDFLNLEDAIIDDAQHSIKKFSYDNVPAFCALGVDHEAVASYVDEVRNADYFQDNIGILEFWWKV